MDKESSKEAIKMFKVLNCMILSNRGNPVTPAILENNFAKLISGQILHCKFRFSSLHDLLAAWFECSLIGGDVVLVLVITQRLKKVVPQPYMERSLIFESRPWWNPSTCIVLQLLPS